MIEFLISKCKLLTFNLGFLKSHNYDFNVIVMTF